MARVLEIKIEETFFEPHFGNILKHGPQQTASPIANILTSSLCKFRSPKATINDHFAAIFENPRVAVKAQSFCFKSPIFRPLYDSRQSTGCRLCGTRIGRLLAFLKTR